MSEIEKLSSVPLFSTLDEAELAGIRSIMNSCQFGAGQTIIFEGDESGEFHVIMHGEVEFLTSDADGNDILLDDAGPGGFFGELSMLSGEPRAVRVRAVTETRTLTLGRDELHRFLLSYPSAAIDVLNVVAKRLHRADSYLKKSVSRSVNDVIQDRATLGQRVADRFAAVMGSWGFIIVQSCILICWVILNVIGWQHNWDPYPFILLNLMLSFQAAYAAPIIMMSQNRQSDKDRLAAEIDHQVNIKAEIKTSLIMSRLDDLERAMQFQHKEHMDIIAQIRDKNKNEFSAFCPPMAIPIADSFEAKPDLQVK